MSFLAVVVLATAVKVSAGDSTGASFTGANPFLTSLSAATAAEMPAKAAELVSKADAKNLKKTTIDVVRAAVGLNPAAAPLIVGSIAQTTPTMAATAVATAVSLVPNQVVALTRAAAAAAPSKAGEIVAAACRELPAKYKEVAEAVAEVVPGAGKEILTAISTSIPALQDSINKILASSKGSVPSMTIMLNEIRPSAEVPMSLAALPQQGTVVSPTLAPPIINPPYVPPPTSHTNLDAGSGGIVPTNGRNSYVEP